MTTATAPIGHPMTWRDAIIEREIALVISRDPRTGRFAPAPLAEQVELGLRELGLRLLGGPVTPAQFDDLCRRVNVIISEAREKLVDYAVDYAESTWPEGPGAE